MGHLFDVPSPCYFPKNLVIIFWDKILDECETRVWKLHRLVNSDTCSQCAGRRGTGKVLCGRGVPEPSTGKGGPQERPSHAPHASHQTEPDIVRILYSFSLHNGFVSRLCLLAPFSEGAVPWGLSLRDAVPQASDRQRRFPVSGQGTGTQVNDRPWGRRSRMKQAPTPDVSPSIPRTKSRGRLTLVRILTFLQSLKQFPEILIH